MIELHLWIIFGILVVFYLLFNWNLFSYKRFSTKTLAKYSGVSVLVPCRNEAAGIRENLESLLGQNYPDFEVIVLDDGSTDGTDKIIEGIAARDARLRFLRGKPLPQGWQGKNHACYQMAAAAKKEWLLFVDADTRHHPDMLKCTAQTAAERNAGFVSTFPRQVFGSFGDALVVPLMMFVLLTYLPMYFVQKKTWKWAGNFSAACGQFIFVRADLYRKIGGHEAIRERISEGPLLAKHAKAAGERIVLADGSSVVDCRMYRGFKQAFDGFSRSVFASMGGSVGAVVFFFVFQTYAFVLPYVILLLMPFSDDFSSQMMVINFICIAIPLIMRFQIHSRTGMSMGVVPFHALSIVLYHWIMINSFVHFRIRRNTVWKGRAYVSPSA